MRIRVLNLDRSTERLASFRAHNPHLSGIERVSADDGRTLDRAQLVADGWFTADVGYTPGAIGNAMSHMRQWTDAAAGDEPLTVLEDDAVLAGNFVAEASRLIETLPLDWDFIQWGYNFDTLMSFELLPGISSCTGLFDQARLRTVLPDIHRVGIRSQAYRLIRSLGILAYSVSPAGAAKLLSFCRPVRPFETDYHLLGRRRNYSIDFIMNGAYEGMSAHVAFPAIAFTANDSTRSTVQDLSDPLGPANEANVQLFDHG